MNLKSFSQYKLTLTLLFSAFIFVACGTDDSEVIPELNGHLQITSTSDLLEVKSKSYSVVNGSVTIGLVYGVEHTITDLSALESITEINGPLIIQNLSNLSTLKGLNNLTKVNGSVIIINNSILKSLDGLESLEQIGGSLRIEENNKLESLSGFSQLKSINDHLQLINNPSLESISALGSVSGHLKYLEIINSNLTNLQGLNGIIEVDKLLISKNNVLENLRGLNQLSIVNEALTIFQNPGMVNLEGLENLNSDDADLFAFQAAIVQNQNLTSLKGLESLKRVHYLSIVDNPNLTDIRALSNLRKVIQSLNLIGLGIENMNGLNNISVSELYISSNQQLKSLEGLNQINGATYLILENLDALESISAIQSSSSLLVMRIFNCDKLTNIDGLNYQSLKGVNLQGNDQLKDFCSLQTPLQKDESFQIRLAGNAYNPTIEDIKAGRCAN